MKIPMSCFAVAIGNESEVLNSTFFLKGMCYRIRTSIIVSSEEGLVAGFKNRAFNLSVE